MIECSRNQCIFIFIIYVIDVRNLDYVSFFLQNIQPYFVGYFDVIYAAIANRVFRNHSVCGFHLAYYTVLYALNLCYNDKLKFECER